MIPLQFQYYDLELYPSIKEQKNFEKNVFNKTHKADSKFYIIKMNPLYLPILILFLTDLVEHTKI